MRSLLMNKRFLIFLPAIAACSSLFTRIPALAQITPDVTLPNNSIVSPATGGGESNFNITIEGGTRAGNNLFHSFREFSVPTGGTAYFNNATDIQNIFSRVTGSSISNIDGLIRANGVANLFLLNPNGIIFGPNARLNIGGSFLGTTANSIQFSDRINFSATAPQTNGLLSINIPIGLQFGQNPGDIAVNGSGHTYTRPPNTPLTQQSEFGSLQVNNGQTFALVGGNISLTGGNLQVAGGRIELGSVAGSSLVGINTLPVGWSLGYENVENFGNIQLSQHASVNISGDSIGEVRIKSDRLTLQDNSLLLSQTFGQLPGGNIDISVGSLEVRKSDNANDNFAGGIFTETATNFRSGAINIIAKNIQSNSSISTTSFGSGGSGDINAIASEAIEITGGGTMSALTRQGNATAGNITVETGKLTLQGGSQIGSSSISNGGAGNVTVTADTIELIGARIEPKNNGFGSFASGILAIAVDKEGGNITINTGSLTIRDGASISAVSIPENNVIPESVPEGSYVPEAGNITINADSIEISGTIQNVISQSNYNLSSGTTYNLPQELASSQISVSSATDADSGNLTINTRTLTIQNGGLINASTAGSSVAGNITINARDSIEINGISPIDPLGIIDQRSSTLIAASQANSLGSGGNIRLRTNSLTVGDSGQINVSGSGNGSAGNLEITANRVSLFNGSTFNAQTQVGTFGNIEIDTEELQVLNNSSISTSAGGTATGGNVGIETDTLVLRDNSSITANAIAGLGGNIQITTQGIFTTNNGVISASSLAGPQLNGTVEVKTPENTVQNAFASLDTTIQVDETIVANRCLAGNNPAQNSLTVTGTSGLPITPYDALNSGYNITGVQALPNARIPKSDRTSPNSQANTQILEASGWIIADNGQIVLTANHPSVASAKMNRPCF